MSWACLARLITTIGIEHLRSCGSHDNSAILGCMSGRTALLRCSTRYCYLLVSAVILILTFIARAYTRHHQRYGGVGAMGRVDALPPLTSDTLGTRCSPTTSPPPIPAFDSFGHVSILATRMSSAEKKKINIIDWRGPRTTTCRGGNGTVNGRRDKNRARGFSDGLATS